MGGEGEKGCNVYIAIGIPTPIEAIGDQTRYTKTANAAPVTRLVFQTLRNVILIKFYS